MFRFLKKILLKKKTNNRKKRNEKENRLTWCWAAAQLVKSGRAGCAATASAPTSSAYSSSRGYQPSPPATSRRALKRISDRARAHGLEPTFHANPLVLPSWSYRLAPPSPAVVTCRVLPIYPGLPSLELAVWYYYFSYYVRRTESFISPLFISPPWTHISNLLHFQPSGQRLCWPTSLSFPAVDGLIELI
jgi:hypothetical protein